MRSDQFGGSQDVEVEGEGRVRQFEAASDGARRQAGWGLLDEQAKDAEASFLRQGRQRINHE